MGDYSLITDAQLDEMESALRRHRWQATDFELEESVFDPRTAEVEAALGEVGIRCLKTEAVNVYRIGPGLDWVGDFCSDLDRGRFGAPG
jgi:hypothetical protein